MAKAIAALSAGHLEGTGRLFVFRHAVFLHGLGEGGPGRGVLKLLGTLKQLIPALGADVNA